MTELFTNTEVKVYTYHSKIINAYTIAGDPYLAHPILLKLYSILGRFFPASFTYIALDVFDKIVKLKTVTEQYQYNKDYKIIYDPKTKKIDTRVPLITINVSSSLIEYIDNEEEIKAILLHEVGHNTQVMTNVLDELFSKSVIRIVKGVTLYTLIFWCIGTIYGSNSFTEYVNKLKDGMVNMHNNLLNTKENSYNLQILASVILIAFVATVAITYLRRRQEIYSDEFAIKCGYGKELERAIKKLNDFQLNRGNKERLLKIKGYNVFDYFLYFANSLMIKLFNILSKFKLGFYPDAETRERYIKEKTKIYDTSNKNIDRTDNIDNSIFK